MHFNDLINKITASSAVVSIPDSWMQGRATFGGLVSALVFRAMEKALNNDKPVRNLQVSFVGPVSAEPLLIETELLREGKNVSQVLGRGIQQGKTKVIIIGSFGNSRESMINLPATIERFDEDPSTISPLAYVPDVLPAFLQHIDLHYCTALPFSGSSDDYIKGFARLTEPQPFEGVASLLCLLDAWPPTTLPLLKGPASASTVSWTIEFVQPIKALSETEFTRYFAEIVESANGYASTRAKMWNESGELLAVSQQTIAHFA